VEQLFLLKWVSQIKHKRVDLHKINQTFLLNTLLGTKIGSNALDAIFGYKKIRDVIIWRADVEINSATIVARVGDLIISAMIMLHNIETTNDFRDESIKVHQSGTT